MKKILENRILILTLTVILISIFLFLAFFVWIIIVSDIIDLSRNRLDFALLIKDFILLTLWLCFIPLVISCIKKFKQNS